jgi:MipA family protein
MPHSIGRWLRERIKGTRDGAGLVALLRLSQRTLLMTSFAAGCVAAVQAQAPLDPSNQQTLQGETSSAPAARAAPGQPAPDSRPPRLEGAVTGVARWGPTYLGAETYGWSFKPGLLLRYGRWSVSSNGSFAARTDDPNDAPRGLGLNLLGDEHDWVKLSLRVDSGRRSEGIDALRGVDDVPRTLRLRLSARKEWGDGWVVTPGVNIDLLNKGVGHTADLSVGKDWLLAPQLKVSVSTGLTCATGSYMRSYFGITPSESSASGYAVYEPGSGFRDLRLGTGLRYEINKRWVAVANASVQRLVGQAADSPTTQAATQWGVGAGLGWRF